MSGKGLSTNYIPARTLSSVGGFILGEGNEILALLLRSSFILSESNQVLALILGPVDNSVSKINGEVSFEHTRPE